MGYVLPSASLQGQKELLQRGKCHLTTSQTPMHIPCYFHFSPVLVIYKISPNFCPPGQRAEGLKGCKNLTWDKNS